GCTAFRRMTIRPTNGENEMFAACVAQRGDLCRQLFRAWVLAALIEQEKSSIAAMLGQARGFFALALVCAPGPALGNFRYAGIIQPDRRAGLGETRQITLSKFPFGAGLHPAHGVNAQAHVCLPHPPPQGMRQWTVSSSRSGVCHIFSIL